MMKKFVALLVVIGMLFCLSGCTRLEEMRKQQAFVGENGEILWNGTVYKALPDSDDIYIDKDYDKGLVYLTEADVPVLLSIFAMEQMLYCSKDGILLEGLSGTNYCREDRYEDILSRIQEKFVPELVSYRYFTEAGIEYYTLTEEQIQTMELVVKSTEPTVLSDGMYLEREQFVDLQAHSEDMLLYQEYAGISVSGNTYYLHWYQDKEELLFVVPEEYRSVFAEIVDNCVEIVNESFQ